MKIRTAVLTALFALGLAGCAGQQTTAPAENPELLQRVQAAERAAAEAQQAAARAQARADEAMAAANANNQKVDRAFRKSQQK